jgi:hypothetical protein
MDLKPKHGTKDRVVKDVPPPVSGYLENWWPEDGLIDLDKLKAHLVGEGRLSKEDAARLMQVATEIFKKEPNLLDVPQPVTGTRNTASSPWPTTYPCSWIVAIAIIMQQCVETFTVNSTI